MKLLKKFVPVFLLLLVSIGVYSVQAQTFDPQKRQLHEEWQGLVNGIPATLVLWNPDVKDHGYNAIFVELTYDHSGVQFTGNGNVQNNGRSLENIRLQAVGGNARLQIGSLHLHANNVNHLSGYVVIDEQRHGVLFQRRGYTDHFVSLNLHTRAVLKPFKSLGQLSGRWDGRINGNAARLVIYQRSGETWIDLYDLKANRTFQARVNPLPELRNEPHAVGEMSMNCVQGCDDLTMQILLLHFLDTDYLTFNFYYQDQPYSAYFKKTGNDPSLDDCGFRGTVLADGRPIASASITFISEDEEIRVTVMTDEEGNYRAQLPCSTYRVRISHPEYGVYATERPYIANGNGLSITDFHYNER